MFNNITSKDIEFSKTLVKIAQSSYDQMLKKLQKFEEKGLDEANSSLRMFNDILFAQLSNSYSNYCSKKMNYLIEQKYFFKKKIQSKDSYKIISNMLIEDDENNFKNIIDQDFFHVQDNLISGFQACAYVLQDDRNAQVKYLMMIKNNFNFNAVAFFSILSTMENEIYCLEEILYMFGNLHKEIDLNIALADRKALLIKALEKFSQRGQLDNLRALRYFFITETNLSDSEYRNKEILNAYEKSMNKFRFINNCAS